MRMFARLLINAGDFERALDFAKRAYSSKHKVPTDVLVYALALESSAKLGEALKICNEAIEINDQMPGVRELHKRLSQ